MYVISIYPRNFTKLCNIKFELSYPKYQTHVQQYFTKAENQAEVKLLGPLFDSDGFGNIISVNDSGITESYNNIAVILLVLIVL